MRADGCCACNCLYYLGSEDTIISSTICNCLYYLGPRTGLQEIEDAEACVKSARWAVLSAALWTPGFV
jgi:hypothetical protein